MRKDRSAFGLLVTVTLVCNGALVLWAAPRIATAAAGLPMFDLRPFGYDFAAALAFLTTLDDAGRAFYLETAQVIDTVFPALVAATLVVALWAVTRGRVRLFALALPLAAMSFDYLENDRVAAMLQTDPAAVTAAMVTAASQATVTKFALVAASSGLLAILSVWRVIRR